MFLKLSSFSRKWKIAGIAALAALIVGITCLRCALFLWLPPGSGKHAWIFEFKEGYTLKKIAGQLEQTGVVSSEGLFILYARLKGAEGRIKAGAYLFNDGMTPAVILHKLLTGDVYVRRFTVPEGYSMYQIAELLDRRGIVGKDAFLEQCVNPALLFELGIRASSVEGYLYPCTYDIAPRTTASALVREMVCQFRKRLSAELEARAKAVHMSTGEILTLASMVEKEAVAPGDRPLIASVFYNRLKKKMPLQSDPTAVYKIRAFAGKVSKKDIMINNSYNTYKIMGLPPGPIGNPGSDAIEAVLNPAKTKYLYFVAKMDGTHYFSATLEEHNNAVNKYLKTGAGQNTDSVRRMPEYRNNYPVLTNRKAR
jgi:UPF0755 protein